MAHNSRRKEIIFMGKIRWIRACALLIMTAAIITACGRGNGNNMTTAPDAGSAGAGTTRARTCRPRQPGRVAVCSGIWGMTWVTASTT